MPGYGGGGGGRRRSGDDEGEHADPNSEQFRKLFIGGLSYETDEKGLREHFGSWGEIVDCVVMRDPNTKRSRGFGFITYKDAEGIDQAQANRPHRIDGRQVETKRAMPREETGSQQSVKKMFVGGIKDDTTEEQVRETFSPFGQIEEVDMIVDKATGKTRGFCFITFDDYDAVDKCVLRKRHKLNGRSVEVKKAISKTEMNAGGSGGSSGGSRRGGRGGGPNRGPGGRADFGGGGGGYGGGYSQGGYGGSSYGGSDYGGGYGGGGYSDYGGGYGGGGNWGSSGGGGSDFGSNYGSSYSGGPVRGGNYGSRGPGPYGGGYGSGNGGGGGGGYGGGSGGYGRRCNKCCYYSTVRETLKALSWTSLIPNRGQLYHQGGTQPLPTTHLMLVLQPCSATSLESENLAYWTFKMLDSILMLMSAEVFEVFSSMESTPREPTQKSCSCGQNYFYFPSKMT